MERYVKGILNRYGAALTVRHGGTETACRGFLRPVTGKYWQNMEHVFSDIGQVPRGQYVYLGPPEVPLEQGDRVVLEGTVYLVRRGERILLRDRCLYRWGLCIQEGAEDTWSNSSN